MSGGISVVFVVIGLLVIAGIAALVLMSVRRNGPDAPPSAPPPPVSEPTPWSSAVAAASAAGETPASGPARGAESLSREALVNPDRNLDPTKWDNRPDGSEEYDEDDPAPSGPSGGPVMDANFFNSLRDRRPTE